MWLYVVGPYLSHLLDLNSVACADLFPIYVPIYVSRKWLAHIIKVKLLATNYWFDLLWIITFATVLRDLINVLLIKCWSDLNVLICSLFNWSKVGSTSVRHISPNLIAYI